MVIETKKHLKLQSSSKINLALWIKEKRPDNYHEVETIFLENRFLSDEVDIEFIESDKLLINVFFLQEELNKIIPLRDNVAYKAAKLFFEAVNSSGICNIKIDKKIPYEAGLGGGSSNAASVLRGLNQIFDFKLSENKLLSLALEIGSDVPFFMLGGACLAKGRGEILTKLENNLELDIKIFKPENISVSTKWAYELIDSREFLPDHKNQIENIIYAMKCKDYSLFFKNIFNDFEMVVFSAHPELINGKKKLLNEGYDAVALCGSGSALFSIKKSR